MNITKLKLLAISVATLSLIVSAAAFIFIIISFTHYHPPVPISVQSTPDLQQLYVFTNDERVKHNLPALTLDPRLETSAGAKCTDMVVNHYWAHDSPAGKTPQDFIQAVIPEPIGHYYSGENIAIDFVTARAVTDAWIASPGHEANILNPHYVDVGYAVCTAATGSVMVVQEFLSNPQ